MNLVTVVVGGWLLHTAVRGLLFWRRWPCDVAKALVRHHCPAARHAVAATGGAHRAQARVGGLPRYGELR
eukprot:13136975-Alexandrium_andersonii.AAC.1